MGGPPITNIRNTSSAHWRIWLKPENRALVRANSFAEYVPGQPHCEVAMRIREALPSGSCFIHLGFITD
jgi:putative SOS response-associated peptidase YedK